jgi:multidrug efflux pump subunit AcrA (membrane-fusion protein)
MTIFRRSTVPWILAGLFAAAFTVLAFSRRSPATAPATGGVSGSPPTSRLTPPARKILYWVDPMHPAYKSDKPGTAPDCGLDLVPVYDDGSTGETREHAVSGYATVTIPEERRQAIGIQVGRVEQKPLAQTIRAVGRVTFDETLLHQIHPKFEGYVEKLFVNYTGRPVRRGEALLSIYSPELLATQEEYLLASRARKDLGASGNPDLARGGSDLLESARQRLLLWDIRPADIQRLERTGKPERAVTLYSPVDGFVMTKNAVAGGRVMPSDTLFEIASLARVWVLADVYESEAPLVRLGQAARVSLSYVPGRTWTGRVGFVAPVVDEKTRTIRVRVELANPDQVLKPEMFADVTLERPLGRVIAVPEAAVLTTGTRSLVFVSKGEGRFEPREVKTGAKTDGWFEIREGLSAGEEVVTQANFLVDSESRLKAAVAGMTSPDAGHPGPGAPAAPPPTTPVAPPAHVHGQ